MGMLFLALFHFAAGLLIGTRFRFAALLPVFALVVVEALIGGFALQWAEWYVVLVVGVVSAQVGYLVPLVLNFYRRPGHQAAGLRSYRSISSTPE